MSFKGDDGEVKRYMSLCSSLDTSYESLDIETIALLPQTQWPQRPLRSSVWDQVFATPAQRILSTGAWDPGSHPCFCWVRWLGIGHWSLRPCVMQHTLKYWDHGELERKTSLCLKETCFFQSIILKDSMIFMLNWFILFFPGCNINLIVTPPCFWFCAGVESCRDWIQLYPKFVRDKNPPKRAPTNKPIES